MLASWRDNQEAKSGMMYSGSNVLVTEPRLILPGLCT